MTEQRMKAAAEPPLDCRVRRCCYGGMKTRAACGSCAAWQDATDFAAGLGLNEFVGRRTGDETTMSTKSSIKWKEHTADGPGYHLYDNVLDCEEDPPVYLRLDGVQVELETMGENGASVTVVIPRAIARDLGLVPNA